MKGPYSIELHPCHPDGQFEPTELPCDVAYVRGFDDDGMDVELCTVYRDGSRALAQRIADVLNAAEGHQQGKER